MLANFSDEGEIVKYVYGNGLISSYTSGDDSAEEPAVSYYLYDLRGSAKHITDDEGDIVNTYAYSSYGQRTVESGTETPVGYCGRDGVLTEANGLLYMRARYYAPSLQRFVNQDIVVGDISNSSSLNRYSYVEGNPVTMVDPFGLCAQRTKSNVSISTKAVVGYNLLQEYFEHLLSYYEDRIKKPAPDYSNCNPADYPDYTEMIDEWMYGKEDEFVNIIQDSFLEHIAGTHFVDIATPVMWFYNQVKDEGPMNIKVYYRWVNAFGVETWPDNEPFVYHDEVIDKGMLGNITYGYVGSVLFPEEVLDVGGGLVETKNRDKTGQGLLGIIKAWYAVMLPNHGEAPEDIVDIGKGVIMYEENH